MCRLPPWRADRSYFGDCVIRTLPGHKNGFLRIHVGRYSNRVTQIHGFRMSIRHSHDRRPMQDRDLPGSSDLRIGNSPGGKTRILIEHVLVTHLGFLPALTSAARSSLFREEIATTSPAPGKDREGKCLRVVMPGWNQPPRWRVSLEHELHRGDFLERIRSGGAGRPKATHILDPGSQAASS